MVLIPPLYVGRPLGFSSRGCPGGLGFAPVRARYGGDAAAWVAGVLAASGTQGNGWLGQPQIEPGSPTLQADSLPSEYQ